MPRGQRKKSKTESNLLKALRFVAVAQRLTGVIEQTHCRIFNNWVCASNGIISAAHKIDEDMQACPQTMTLIDALEQAPGTASITIQNRDVQTLDIKSENFAAIVPCVQQNQLPAIGPDAPTHLCNDEFLKALAIVGKLVSDDAPKLVNASIQLRSGSVLATNGQVILEAWHGIEFPSRMIAPKLLATTLAKLGKSIYRMGFSATSITIWYQDESWVKCQLHPANSQLPDLDQYLNVPNMPIAVPKNFFEVAKRLQPFSEDGFIYFTVDGARVSSPTIMSAAAEKVDKVPPGVAFPIAGLLLIAPYATKIHFNNAHHSSIFFGENLRGVIATKDN